MPTPTENETLRPEDLQMLLYFWEKKQDLESFLDWPRIKPILERNWPELIAAWQTYKAAERTLTALLKDTPESLYSLSPE